MTDLERAALAWRSEPAGAEDLTDVLARARDMDRAIRLRDRIETGVAVLVAPFFGYVAFAAPPILSRIGAALIVAACVLIPLRLRAARRQPPDHGRPTREAVALELDRLRAQERLLSTSLWWYFGPLGLGAILVMTGPGGSAWYVGGSIVVVTALLGAMLRLNLRTVRNDLRPRIRHLEIVAQAYQESSS